jgi:hypothetical protein
MTDQIKKPEVVSRILYILARFQYSPKRRSGEGDITSDNMFMEKISALFLDEPRLTQKVAT